MVGGGYIGLELGTAFAKLGSKVTVVEALPKILPQYDAELTRPIVKHINELGITILTGAKAKGMSTKGDALLIETADGKDERIPADKVLVTVGRKPVTTGWGLEEIDLDMDGKFVRIDDKCRTSMRGVYAIGDVTGEPMLAHRAMAQGEMVAEIIAGENRSWDKRAIAGGVFYRSGDCFCWLFSRRGEGSRTRNQDRPVSLCRQWPRHDTGRRGGFRPRRRRCRQPSYPWNPGGRAGCIRALGLLCPCRWRWARDWKISPERSTPTRRRAKVFRKPPSRRWDTRCISDATERNQIEAGG